MDEPTVDTSQDMPAAPAAATIPAGISWSPQARPHYTPQFSATTQMILKRIKGEPSSQPKNLSSVISSASAAGTINQSSYEDAKRRLVMTMNTQISLPMPSPAQAPVQRPSPAVVLPKIEPNQSPVIMPPPRGRGRPPKLDKKGKPPRGTKRMRVGKDEDDGSSALSDPPDSGEDDEYANPTMTKSGRQVSKPTQFNPVTAPGTNKRKQYGKRTEEQALCKMCHEPCIDDEFIKDESQEWFCRGCVAKKERSIAKKKAIDWHKGVSWSNKSAEQKRSYLTGLSKDQLVNTIMYTLELHPDLALFPEGNGAKRGRPPAGSHVSSLPASPTPLNFAQSISTPPMNGIQSNEGSGRNARANSEDVPPSWPRQGSGALVKMRMNEDDFDDRNDSASFSVITYDAKSGNKLVENGIPVLGQNISA
ncbi:hypothetical protein TruAng_001868 [Truncatella angustata]|nr:hypothetical protein TruAng_001868 [Truncatella angustata]